ncbi:MAG: cytidine deaminase [Pseudomonadota bacterium]
MSSDQNDALAAARALITARASEGRHHVAATLITTSGRAHTAVNTDSILGRAAICAEAVALGMACAAESGAEIAFAVAVNRRLEIIPPCGLCRELMLDYSSDALIAVADDSAAGFRAVPLAELMPSAYKAGRRGV